uniref:Transmembrane protein 25 n=1 Tax=Oncorhynchus kisutch TaxID=8019 RepID=A0A8C7JS79_ONCKI
MQGMECLCLMQGPGTTVLLLHTLAWAWTGAIEHDPKIDGRHQAALILKENVTHKFNCQSEGWNPNRQRQPADKRTPGRLVMTSVEESGLLKSDFKHNSTFSLRARKWDTELVCAASSPRSGESYNTTVTLNVQFLPEILRVNAHYTETSDPGLSLVLFALVRSNPSAHITWVDQSGQLVANTSNFLILDLRSYPWLTNHTLQVTLSSLSGNVSVNTSNSVVAAQSNLTLAGLQGGSASAGHLTGGAVGFITLLILCLLHKGKTVIGETGEQGGWEELVESPTMKVDKIYLPRENMSLPSNMQLKDLSTLHKAREAAKHHLGEKMSEEEEDLSAAYAARGKTGFRGLGLVNSKSSDEIWL